MLLSAEHISKNYGMKQLLQDVSLYLNEKDRTTPMEECRSAGYPRFGVCR